MPEQNELEQRTLAYGEVTEQMQEQHTKIADAMQDPMVVTRVSELTGISAEVVSETLNSYSALATRSIDEFLRVNRPWEG